MTDIALLWDPVQGIADMALSGPDLQTDSGLRTAVIISLFTDRQAEPGDVIPDGSTDPRGWWGDMPIAASQQDSPPASTDFIGSRLWLLDRALQTNETLRRAESYAQEALAWMTAAGVAGSITAAASFPAIGQIALAISINQAGSLSTFNFAWANS